MECEKVIKAMFYCIIFFAIGGLIIKYVDDKNYDYVGYFFILLGTLMIYPLLLFCCCSKNEVDTPLIIIPNEEDDKPPPYSYSSNSI